MSDEVQPIGRVRHYYNRLGVAVIELRDHLILGDWVHFYGCTTNFVQPVSSMQSEHNPIGEAFPAETIAIRVDDRVRDGDLVYPYSQPV